MNTFKNFFITLLLSIKGIFKKAAVEATTEALTKTEEKLTGDEMKSLIKNSVVGLIEDKTDGITSDIALVMLEAITKSQLNNVTAGMVSKAISTLKKEVEQL